MSRLKEPSTWAGFAVLLETVKLFLPMYAGVITGLQAVTGGVAVMLRESGHGVAP